jgi:hypothetical protein
MAWYLVKKNRELQLFYFTYAFYGSEYWALKKEQMKRRR